MVACSPRENRSRLEDLSQDSARPIQRFLGSSLTWSRSEIRAARISSKVRVAGRTPNLVVRCFSDFDFHPYIRAGDTKHTYEGSKYLFGTHILRSPRKTMCFTCVKKFADERIGVEEFESRFSPIFDS